MKRNIIVCLILFVTTEMYAVSMNPDSNATVLSKESEIKVLKARVKSLEAELAQYKQVKPVASKVALTAKKITIKKKVVKKKKFVLHTTAPKKISAYFTAAYQSIDDLKAKLSENGFEILAIDKIFKEKTVISVSNEALKNTNSFLSVLHILVNNDSEIRLQNPSYFGAAYLQESYKYGDFNETIKSLELVLGDLYTTTEQYAFDDLSNYNFMLGMPHFKDTITVAEGDDILSKLSVEGSEKYISYTLMLPNGSVLVGHKLRNVTYDYLKKISIENNAQLLPYQVIIEDNRAYMLNPKYYLALSLPRLSMTDFMKIASAPEEIAKDISQAYK